MSGSATQKLKLLYIMKLLQRKADREKPITVAEIITELKKLGIEAERKSVYSDISVLNEFGLDIRQVKGRDGGYFISEPVIDYSDIKVLWDTVHASNYISSKLCSDLKKKLRLLVSENQELKLRKRVYAANRTLRQSDDFWHRLDIVHKAISEKKQITFNYSETFVSGKKTAKNKHSYTVSPYIVSCGNGNYFLISGCPQLEGLNNFYIDRMEDIVITSDKATDVREFVGDMEFDLLCYSRGIYDMYSGDSVKITIQCTAEALDLLSGMYGGNLEVRKSGSLFCVKFESELSETLLSWLLVNYSGVKVLAPAELIDILKNMAKDIYIEYS